MFDLKGKVAVVTGGNGGIGLGTARGLASASAQVVVVGPNEARPSLRIASVGCPCSTPSHRGLGAAGLPSIPEEEPR